MPGIAAQLCGSDGLGVSEFPPAGGVPRVDGAAGNVLPLPVNI